MCAAKAQQGLSDGTAPTRKRMRKAIRLFYKTRPQPQPTSLGIEDMIEQRTASHKAHHNYHGIIGRRRRISHP